ncbi:trigger factor [Thermodesulfobium narugense DSM 14796]|uniref:Trigger factor n=1 Tax=Thermodesulfobium narugense DSM 14796 TaxID=747365 RepID=M1E6J8_9BACT|nr:trigger factor [Thermodesulfobium narugense]AEE14821.1 trigger factor [Thermodesulfobium narugense DSM 14796]
MNYSKTYESSTKVEFDVIFPKEEIENEWNQTFNLIASRTNIAGFRRGKVPRNILEKVIRDEDIIENLKEVLLRKTFNKIRDEQGDENLYNIFKEDESEIQKDKEYRFKMVFEYWPDPELGDYRSIKIKANEVSVSDEEIENQLNLILQSFAKWNNVEDGEIQLKDVVEITMETRDENNEEVKEYTGKSAISINPDIKDRLKPLRDALLGKKVGDEVECDIELESKRAHVKAKVDSIRRKELSNWSDIDLQANFQVESLEELKEQQKSILLMNKLQQEIENQKNEILEKIREISKIYIPETALQLEKQQYINDLEKRIKSRQVSKEEINALNSGKDEFSKFADMTVKKSIEDLLIIEKISKDLGIVVEDAEIEQRLRAYRKDLGEADLNKWIQDLKNDKRTWGQLIADVRRERVFSALLTMCVEREERDDTKQNSEETKQGAESLESEKNS